MIRKATILGLAVLAQFAACTSEDPGGSVPMTVGRPTPEKPAAELPRPAPPAVVIVLRHAEKAATEGKDPELSDEGRARAQVLLHMFGKTGITSVYASHYVRTQQTVAPLAEKLGLTIQIVTASEVDTLVRQILSNPGGTVLVAAHSDTVGEIVEKLGAGKVEPIEETDYDNLYIVTFDKQGAVKLVSTQYGAPT